MNDDTTRIAVLIQKYKTGTLSASERKELLVQAERHATLKEVMRDMETSFLGDDETGSVLESYRAERMRKKMENYLLPERRIYHLRWWSASVAAVLVCVSVWLFFFTTNSEDTEWRSVTTLPGEQEHVTLPDGTLIVLNGGTTLSYPEKFSDNQRVVIINGEAFFDVFRDESRPFLVVGKYFTTKVLGTSFNIDTQIEPGIAVTEGKVQVIKTEAHIVHSVLEKPVSIWAKIKRNRESVSHILDDISEEQKMLVEADQFVEIDTLSGGMFLGYGMASNWKDGQFTFYNVPIERIAQQLFRYYGEEIVVDDAIKECEVTLPATNKTLEQLLNTLALLRKGKVVKKENVWHLQGRNCKD